MRWSLSNEMRAPNAPGKLIAVVDAIVYDEKTRSILLIRRKYPPFQGMYALIGGHVDAGETPEDAIVREVKEESGIDASVVRSIGVYSKPGRDPRGSYASTLFEMSFSGHQEAKGGDDAAVAEWVPLDAAANMNLAFDHSEMLADYLRLKS